MSSLIPPSRDPAEFRDSEIRRLAARIEELESELALLLCTVSGCRKAKLKKGYCDMHYRRYMRSGDPGEVQPRTVGERSPSWKGDAVGKAALHEYIRNRLPKPSLCQCCRSVPPRDLANISQEYRRDIADWEWLCRRCHMRKDGRAARLTSAYRKLTPAAATEIRRKYENGSGLTDLAKEYGVTKQTIRSIVRRLTYIYAA